MPEYSNPEEKGSGTDNSQEQIYISEVIKVILKWKYYILGFTVMSGIISAVIIFNSKKIYEVETIIKPGIMNISPGGRIDYTDRPTNIRELINSSSFKKRLIEYIRKNEKKWNLPHTLSFMITVGRGKDAIIRIIKETANIEQGISILNYLIQFLELQYQDIIIENKEQSARQLARAQTQLRELEISKKIRQEYIDFYRQRTKKLIVEMEQIKKNTATITDTGSKALSKDSKSDDRLLANFFYINAIQQSSSLISSHESQIKQYELKIREFIDMIELINQKIQNVSEKIDYINFKIGKLKGIDIIQQPYATKNPVKPKATLNIAVASICGFFLMIILALFIEAFYKKNRNN